MTGHRKMAVQGKIGEHRDSLWNFLFRVIVEGTKNLNLAMKKSDGFHITMLSFK